MEDTGVDACVVHLGDHKLGRAFHVVEHRREVLLDVGLALMDPGELTHVARPLDIGKFTGVGVDKRTVVDTSAVSGAPCGLVMGSQLPMDDLHLLGAGLIACGGVPLSEGTGIAIDDHGRA